MVINHPIEVELRAEINSDVLENKDYSLPKESNEHDIYYSYQSDTSRTWIARIRNKNGKFLLTFKSSKKFGDGAWDEVNINISSKKATQLNDFFLNNGFFIDVQIKKFRRTYRIDDMEVNIDNIENLGTFIEAEIMSNPAEITHAKLKIQDFFKSIGVGDNQIIIKGYVHLMRERLYGKSG